ncbi:hypothetical protein M8C13_09830 [Crossiella sp. SN42]|uniref:hypothetical protein n=1 Tax=Crossiella sp. SN42 TaxID=2944808 RepID=UPI00207D71B1|nr:hypothetical protein [Crossiella sp. SN42]MCO1576054.1 hypothetical protein [Crossiella sp. SN42]
MFRSTLRTIAATAAIAVAAMLVPATVSAAAGSSAPSSVRDVIGPPIGVWDGRISHPDGHIDIKLSFRLNGTLCLIAPPPDPGGGIEGSGRWRLTDPNSFNFNGRERYFDGSGATTGSLTFDMNADYQGLTEFVGKGTATLFDAQGNELGTLPTTSRFKRISLVPVNCS